MERCLKCIVRALPEAIVDQMQSGEHVNHNAVASTMV